jgi:transcriptional repressor NrdR
MNCPFCGSEKVKVTNTRLTRQQTETWRRRLCIDCHEAFTTYEKIDLSYLKVKKNDGRIVYYSRAKLYSGIYHSTMNLKKVDRGDMGALAEEITNQVENKILKLRTKMVTTAQIFEIVSEILKKDDPAIFLHYLAYFKGKSDKISKYLSWK